MTRDEYKGVQAQKIYTKLLNFTYGIENFFCRKTYNLSFELAERKIEDNWMVFADDQPPADDSEDDLDDDVVFIGVMIDGKYTRNENAGRTFDIAEVRSDSDDDFEETNDNSDDDVTFMEVKKVGIAEVRNDSDDDFQETNDNQPGTQQK